MWMNRNYRFKEPWISQNIHKKKIVYSLDSGRIYYHLPPEQTSLALVSEVVCRLSLSRHWHQRLQQSHIHQQQMQQGKLTWLVSFQKSLPWEMNLPPRVSPALLAVIESKHRYSLIQPTPYANLLRFLFLFFRVGGVGGRFNFVNGNYYKGYNSEFKSRIIPFTSYFLYLRIYYHNSLLV